MGLLRNVAIVGSQPPARSQRDDGARVLEASNSTTAKRTRAELRLLDDSPHRSAYKKILANMIVELEDFAIEMSKSFKHTMTNENVGPVVVTERSR